MMMSVFDSFIVGIDSIKLEQPFLMETVNFGDAPFIITINCLYQGKKP